MIYYILFISLFLTSLLDFTKINKAFKNRLFILWIIIFILFKGLRWDTGTDFNQFYACFKYSDWSNIFHIGDMVLIQQKWNQDICY